MSPDYELVVESDGTLTYTYREGAEAEAMVKVDHVVTGFTIGMIVVSGDAAVTLELGLLGEVETAVVALDPVTARSLAEGLATAVERVG